METDEASLVALYVAGLCGIGYGLRQIVEVQAARGAPIERVMISGGAGASDLVRQLLADAAGKPVVAVAAEEPVLLNARTFTVGRTSDNDICIPSHLVSRHHARLLIGPTGVILEDSGSTNGCFVNGEQVHHRLLRDGDVLEIGDMRYRLVTRPGHDTKVRTPVAALTVVPTLVDKSPGGVN